MKNKQYPLRVTDRWLKEMKKKAKSKGRVRGTKVSVADLIREACKKKYGVAEK